MVANRARACEQCGALHRLFGDYCQRCTDEIRKGFERYTTLMDSRQPYVYAVGVVGDDNSVVKFGYTKTLDERLRNLQCGSPVKLEYLAKDCGLKWHESAIHLRLKADRVHGEWFTRSIAAMEVIEAMRKGSVSGLLGLPTGKNPKRKNPIWVAGYDPQTAVS